MSRLAKKRTCVRSKMPEFVRGQRLSRVGEHPDVGDVGQRDHDRAARTQPGEHPGEHGLGLGEVLEHVAGEDGVEGLVAKSAGSSSARSHWTTASRRLRASCARAGVALDADDLARAGALEQGAVVAATAAQIEDAQSARVDELEERGLGVAEVAGAHVHRRIIQRVA